MKKTLLLITLSLSVIAIASAQTQAQSQRIRRMLDSCYQKTLNSGITQGPIQSQAALRREQQALDEGKATANYILRVCADKRPALLLLKQIATEQNAIDQYKTTSARPPLNVIINNVNMTPFRLPMPSYNPGFNYHPSHSHNITFHSDGIGGGTFYDNDGYQIGRFSPDGVGGGTFYGE
jgi:hypothetical protein